MVGPCDICGESFHITEIHNHILKEHRIKVVNLNKSIFDIYIGRLTFENINGNKVIKFHESKWHNPFRIGIDGTRSEVLEKYKQYIFKNNKLYNSLHELDGLILGCWCKPKKCHGDILKELRIHQLTKLSHRCIFELMNN